MLSEKGHLEIKGSFNSLRDQIELVQQLITKQSQTDVQDVASTETTKSPPTRAAGNGPTAEQFSDLTRQTGDKTVYLYYLKAVGKQYAVAAIIIIAIHLFVVNFPR